MTSAVDSTRILRQAAQRAFLRGERRLAFDLYRCDPGVSPDMQFGQFEISFARSAVQGDPLVFTEALLRAAHDQAGIGAGEQLLYHRALTSLDRMESQDSLALEYALLKSEPHKIQPPMVAEIVLRIMGRL